MFRWSQCSRNLAKWYKTWNKKIHLSLCFSGHSASHYWWPEALQIFMESAFWLLFLHGKNGWNNNPSLCVSSLVDCCQETAHNPAPLKVSMCTFYVPAIYSWTHTLDILSQVWREPVPECPLWVRGWCQGSGDNKVFIPVGMDVQTVVAVHPLGAT